MRSVAFALSLTAVALMMPVASGSAAEGPRLSPGGEAEFPHRSYVLSLPDGSSADPDDVQILENGQPVRELSVTSAGSTSSAAFGTVLVIDASASMRGRAIENAMAAARTFASHRAGSQQLGIVTFNRTAQTLLEPTSDDSRIMSVLENAPALAKQTHLGDGVMAALEALQDADVAAGSVVVLSDGADTGSQASVSEVASAARRQGVRIFTVGLQSRKFDEGALTRLARSGMAEYSAAPTAGDLDRIYGELGSQLSSEHLVQYASTAGSGKRVIVEAVVSGIPGRATLSYRSAKLGAAPLSSAGPEASGFWGSAAAMFVVGFGSVFLVCFGVAWVLLERRRPETAEQRVAAFVATREPDPRATSDARPGSTLYDRVESGLRGRAWWRRFVVDVEIARIDHKPAQIAVIVGGATLLTMWLFATISGAAWVALFAVLIPWGAHMFVSYRAAKQRLTFGEQLSDNLQVVASAMRAGQSFAGALAVAVEDAPEPAKGEFQRVVADERLGVPIENSLGVVVERMENRDLHQVALVASLQREAGGNAAEVLERVAETIRERVALRRLISTLTAQGRMSRWVVSLIPVALMMFLALTNPDYLEPLLKTTSGNVMLAVATLMVLGGSLVIKKIVDIKV